MGWRVCSKKEKDKCTKVAEKEKAAYVPSEAYQKAAEIVQNGKAVKVQKDREGSAKAKGNVKKQRIKVKTLKLEINLIEKKIAAAKKLQGKLDAKRELLEKAEAKLLGTVD